MFKRKMAEDDSWRNKFGLYVAVILINSSILAIIRGLYVGQPRALYQGFLSIWTIVAAGVAGGCMLFYLRKAYAFHLTSQTMQILCACAYGLCGYVTMQEHSLRAYGIHIIFPVVFYALEHMVYRDKHLLFILMASAMLFVNPSAGIPVLFFLFLWTVIELSLLGRWNLGEFMHLLLCYLLVILLSGAWLLYYLASYLSELEEYRYAGFSISCPFTVLLSRFLPGSVASINFIGINNRMDLYFGLFLLLFAIFFFTRREIQLRKKIYYGIFLILVLCLLEFSPVEYLLNLGIYEETRTVSSSFLLIFYGVRLAAEGMSLRSKEGKFSFLVTGVVFGLWLVVSWMFSGHNISEYFAGLHVLLGIIYLVFLYLYSRKSLRNSMVNVFILVLVLGEFGVSTYVNVNTTLLPDNISISPSFYFQNVMLSDAGQDEEEGFPAGEAVGSAVSQAEADSIKTSLEKRYKDYVKEHQDHEVLNNVSELAEFENLQVTDFQIDPDRKNGKLFLNIFEIANSICHDVGIKGDLFLPCSYTLEFAENENYTVVDLGNHIYNIEMKDEVTSEIIPFKAFLDGGHSGKLYLQENGGGTFCFFDISGKEESIQGYTNVMGVTNNRKKFLENVEILFYLLDEDVYQSVLDYIDSQRAEYVEEEEEGDLLVYDYVGVGISFLGGMILLFLYGYNDKQKVFEALEEKKRQIAGWKKGKILYRKIYTNRMYFASFFIPFFMFLICMIGSDCAPFGDASFLDGDGAGLFFPLFMENYHKYEEGNRFLSLDIGYGFDLSLYYTIHVLSYLYHFLPLKALVPALHSILAIGMGLCGFSMMYYMTHRIQESAASKEDFRLLLPSLGYAMSSYMLGVHHFLTWHLVLWLFPILLLEMDRLIYQRKYLGYIFLLGACILIEIQLAMFMCVYLVIRFLGCHFEGGMDFLKKAAVFGGASLFGGGCGFLVVHRTLMYYGNTLYTAKDSVFPSFGFHGSFLEEWKNFMMFGKASAITEDDGYVMLYCGILTLLMVFVFVMNRSFSFSQKVRRLLPIIFLLFSFNEQVLSYLWNGMHYQANVPNRYAFIMVFLMVELAYDSLCAIRQMTMMQFGLAAMALILFMGVCQQGSTGAAELAFLLSIAACCVYLLFLVAYRYAQKREKVFAGMIFCFVAGICMNMYVIMGVADIHALTFYYGDYLANTEMIQQNMKGEGFFRCNYASSVTKNSGSVFGTGAVSAFNSYISVEQMDMQTYYGLTTGTNYIAGEYNASPYGFSLCSGRYVFYPAVCKNVVKDLELYDYLGNYGRYYVFENKNALSIGVYEPEELVEMKDYDLLDSTEIFDRYPYSYHTEAKGRKGEVFGRQLIEYDITGEKLNGFFFTDTQGKRLSAEEAESMYDNGRYAELTLNLSFVPVFDGYAYIATGEFVPIRQIDMKKDKNKKIEEQIPFERMTVFSVKYIIAYYNKEASEHLLDIMSSNQLEDVQVGNDAIVGRTNYDKDGYTVYSLAYSKNWHAYLDGKPVKVKKKYNGCLYIETPRGEHTIELRYVPYGLKFEKAVTGMFWMFLLIVAGIGKVIKRRGDKTEYGDVYGQNKA